MCSGFPGGSTGKKSACNAGATEDRSPGRGHDNPLQYACLENPMDRSPAGYTPKGRKTVKHDYGDLTQAESVAKSLVHSHFFKFTHLMFESNKIFFKHLSPWWL